jgi:hypothetical protein
MFVLITGRKGGGVGSVGVEFTEGLDTAYDLATNVERNCSCLSQCQRRVPNLWIVSTEWRWAGI